MNIAERTAAAAPAAPESALMETPAAPLVLEVPDADAELLVEDAVLLAAELALVDAAVEDATLLRPLISAATEELKVPVMPVRLRGKSQLAEQRDTLCRRT